MIAQKIQTLQFPVVRIQKLLKSKILLKFEMSFVLNGTFHEFFSNFPPLKISGDSFHNQ